MAVVWLLCGLAFVGADDADRALTPSLSRPVLRPVKFQKASWDKVIAWLAEPEKLNVHQTATIAGTFTYVSEKPMAAEDAWSLVQRVLLERGVTLLRKEKYLIVALLADGEYFELVPDVPADLLEHVPPERLVRTVLTVHALAPAEAASELGQTLSARGKLTAAPGGKLIALDRAGVILELKRILAAIDPVDQVGSAQVRVFKLRHASAGEANAVVSDLIATAPKVNPGAPGAPAMLNPEEIANKLWSRKMLKSFTPGISFGGESKEVAKAAIETRITVDHARNALLVSGAPAVLAQAAGIVAAIDVPTAHRGSERAMVIRTYPMESAKSAEIAGALSGLFPAESGFLVAGTNEAIVVRGDAGQQRQVEKIVRDMSRTAMKVAVFPLAGGSAELVVEQLKRLFAASGEEAIPSFVPDMAFGQIAVRGTEAHLDETRRFLGQLGVLADRSSVAPSIRGRSREGNAAAARARDDGKGESRRPNVLKGNSSRSGESRVLGEEGPKSKVRNALRDQQKPSSPPRVRS